MKRQRIFFFFTKNILCIHNKTIRLLLNYYLYNVFFFLGKNFKITKYKKDIMYVISNLFNSTVYLFFHII